MDLQIKRPSIVKVKKIKLEDQHTFLQNLKRLIENGYPLLDALTIIHWDHKYSALATHILESLKEGMSIDQALNQSQFNDKIVSYLHLSRTNGDLESTLGQCCLMLDQQMRHMKRFRQTMRYPLILLILFVILLYFVKESVYPSFSQLLLTTDQSTPLTEYSSKVINTLFEGLKLMLVIVIIGFFSWLIIRNKLQIKSKLFLYSHLPLLKSYKRLNTTFVFSFQMSSLIKAGFTLKEALLTLADQSKPSIISYYSEFILKELEKGNRLAEILPRCLLFEHELTSIITRSTSNQDLQKDLNVYAEFLMERVQEKISKVITLIQPIFFILLAGLIILLYLSLMLPMFQLIQNM